MRTNFTPIRFFDLGMAIGATASGLQSLGGLIQAIGGNRQRKRATKELENLKSPTYKQNQSILDYYNKALARYNVSPTDSALYTRQKRNVDRGVATGIRALQDSGDVLGGISSLVQSQNDAMLNAEAAAEQERTARFGQLGGAAGMKADEDRAAFQINEYSPFERKYNLLAQKAAGGSQIMNAGLSNIFGGLQGIGQTAMINQMYGGGATGSAGGQRAVR